MEAEPTEEADREKPQKVVIGGDIFANCGDFAGFRGVWIDCLGNRAIDCRLLEKFGAVYIDRPGLAILKHTFDLSDEVVCARWVENPVLSVFPRRGILPKHPAA